MIREERDAGFWQAVHDHPEVKPHVSFGVDLDLAELVAHPGVLPLAADHGGFFLVRLDGLGRVWELHTLFTPEGWGREVAQALKEAVALVFAKGAQVITTYEVEGHWRSQPPRSYRFAPAGDFAPAMGRNLKTWVLTKSAWEGSPARARMSECL